MICSTILFFHYYIYTAQLYIVFAVFFAKALLPNVLDVCLVLRVLLLAVVCFFILETLGLSTKEVQCIPLFLSATPRGVAVANIYVVNQLLNLT